MAARLQLDRELLFTVKRDGPLRMTRGQARFCLSDAGAPCAAPRERRQPRRHGALCQTSARKRVCDRGMESPAVRVRDVCTNTCRQNMDWLSVPAVRGSHPCAVLEGCRLNMENFLSNFAMSHRPTGAGDVAGGARPALVLVHRGVLAAAAHDPRRRRPGQHCREAPGEQTVLRNWARGRCVGLHAGTSQPMACALASCFRSVSREAGLQPSLGAGDHNEP